MTPIETELRRQIAEARASGQTLKAIADAANVGYFKLYNWLNGRSPILNVGVADRLYRSLGGKGFTK